MEKRLSLIMLDIFDVKEHDITDESSMDNIDKWDSLGHLKLIMSIEKEFGVSIDATDIIELTSLKKIILYLKNNMNLRSD